MRKPRHEQQHIYGKVYDCHCYIPRENRDRDRCAVQWQYAARSEDLYEHVTNEIGNERYTEIVKPLREGGHFPAVPTRQQYEVRHDGQQVYKIPEYRIA